MPPLLEPAWLAVLLFIGAALAWYIAVAAAAAAVLRNRASAFILAGGLPAMAGVLWFALCGRPGAALSLALATAMAACTLVIGIVTSSEPSEGRRVMDDPGRRLNASLLPIVGILLVAGFGGELTLLHAVLLLLAGGVVAWLGVATGREVPTAAIAPSSSTGSGEQPAATSSPRWATVVQIALVAILAITGAGLAVGSVEAANRHKGLELDLEYAVLISAVLVLPLIGVGMRFAHRGQSPVAMRGLTLLAVCMICLAVPLVVFCDVIRQTVIALKAQVPWRTLLMHPPALVMPLRLWRTDTVLLGLAGLLLLPPAAGRWRLGGLEALALILLYVLYLFLALVVRR